MRYILILMFGILCFMLTGCPADEPEEGPAISDETNRKPDIAGKGDTPAMSLADEDEADEAMTEGEEEPIEGEGDEEITEGEGDEEVTEDEAEATVCETCGNDPCTCEKGEEHSEDDGHGH